MLDTKRMRFPIDVILVCIRWYAAYPLSYRHLEEMMQEHGVYVDHSSVSRWAIKFLPLLEKVFRKHKRAVGVSWRMDETADAHEPQRPNEQRKSNGTFVTKQFYALAA